jgi:hypothetical protein
MRTRRSREGGGQLDGARTVDGVAVVLDELGGLQQHLRIVAAELPPPTPPHTNETKTKNEKRSVGGGSGFETMDYYEAWGGGYLHHERPIFGARGELHLSETRDDDGRVVSFLLLCVWCVCVWCVCVCVCVEQNARDVVKPYRYLASSANKREWYMGV